MFDWTPGRGLLLQSFRISYVPVGHKSGVTVGRTLFDWTPGQVRGDGRRTYEHREAHFGSIIYGKGSCTAPDDTEGARR